MVMKKIIFFLVLIFINPMKADVVDDVYNAESELISWKAIGQSCKQQLINNGYCGYFSNQCLAYQLFGPFSTTITMNDIDKSEIPFWQLSEILQPIYQGLTNKNSDIIKYLVDNKDYSKAELKRFSKAVNNTAEIFAFMRQVDDLQKKLHQALPKNELGFGDYSHCF